MRIRIDDEFDSDLEEEYKTIDKDLVVGNGALADGNVPIIEVNEINMMSDKDITENKIMNVSKGEINNYNLDNGFSIEIQGATIIDTNEANKQNKNLNRLDEKDNNIKEERKFEKIKSNEKIEPNEKGKLIKDELVKDNKVKENYKTKDSNKNIKFNGKEKKDSVEIKKIKGKITVYAKLDDVNGKCISDAKINLYALNGISPKLISSKFTDKKGIVIFDNLEEGSYRVIEIVNRKYFEKPTYVQWNEVTINKNLHVEEIIVVNKIKRY